MKKEQNLGSRESRVDTYKEVAKHILFIPGSKIMRL